MRYGECRQDYRRDRHANSLCAVLAALIILSALTGCIDRYTGPPSAVRDLRIADTDSSAVTLTWTSPGVNASQGDIEYDVRYSPAVITDRNWSLAYRFPQGAASPFGGAADSCRVTELDRGVTYWFAVKLIDLAGGVSELSNVVSTTTTAGAPPLARDGADVVTQR
jgi:hypothetical protein